MQSAECRVRLCASASDITTIHHYALDTLTHQSPTVRLFASARSWVDEEALRQLYATVKLEGVRLAVGFPDLHPGKSSPVGAAFVSERLAYPCLIGGDIGCGMALFKAGLAQRDITLDRWADLRFDLEHPWEGEVREVLEAAGLASTEFDQALGTIGGGNHFAELQVVDEVLEARAFRRFGLGRQQLALLSTAARAGWVNPSCALMWKSMAPTAGRPTRSAPLTSGPTTWPCAGRGRIAP